MKKLVFILAALFFLDMSVYAQRSGRSSSERSSSSSRKEQTSRSSSSRSKAVKSSSSSSSRSSSAVRPSRSSSRSSSVSSPSNSRRSKSVSTGNSRSNSSRKVSPSSNSSRSSGYRQNSSSRGSSSYNSQGRSQSNGSSYSNRGRSNDRNGVSRSSSSSSGNSNYQSGSRRGNGGNDYEGNNGDRRYRNNGNKFENRGTKTRTYWDRSSGSSSSGSSNRGSVNTSKSTSRSSGTRPSSVSRVERKPETRTSVRRVERNTPNGVVIDTRGTTYRKNYHVVRETRVVHHHVVRPRPIEYRRVHYVYRAPRRWNFFWSVNVYNDFCRFYPHVTNWHYRTGARINTISAYDAMFFIGEVKRVYGEVQEVFYSREDDAYYLYVGARFPYHDFSVVIPGREYRRFDFPPLNRLNLQHIWAMGLITEYDGRPEILVKRPYQLGIY